MNRHSALVIQEYWLLMMVIHVLFTYFIIEALIVMLRTIKNDHTKSVITAIAKLRCHLGPVSAL